MNEGYHQIQLEEERSYVVLQLSMEGMVRKGIEG